MAVPSCCVNWDSFRSFICNGFARLQQAEEFVDMTLAADGYLVKVHRNIIALASPYLKALMASATCQNPVIFLNNVSYDTLCSILQYIYTGQVQVPTEKLSLFLDAAKSLCIVGVKDMRAPMTAINTNVNAPNEADPPMDISFESMNSKEKDTNVSNTLETGIEDGTILTEHDYTIDRNSEESNQVAGNIVISNKNNFTLEINPDVLRSKSMTADGVEVVEDKCLNPTLGNPSDDNITESDLPKYTLSENDLGEDTMFTVSNRGAVQLIWNDMMYAIHYQANRGQKSRWRCLNYRSTHCNAYVDSEGEYLINRCFLHNHPSHKNKILKKVKEKMVFNSYKAALFKANRKAKYAERSKTQSETEATDIE